MVPSHRPGMTGNVLANFRRQTYKNKRLLVVENGDALGVYEREWPFPEVRIIKSQATSASGARNAGLNWLRLFHPGAFVVTMDDDDYYGPEYLSEHALHARPWRINGKRWGWVSFDSGVVYFGNGWTPGPARGLLLGGTMGFFEHPELRFDESVLCGEDSVFCREANSLGMSTNLLTAQHYCLSREGSPDAHTHKAKDSKIWRYAGFAGIRVGGGKALCSGPPPQGPTGR